MARKLTLAKAKKIVEDREICEFLLDQGFLRINLPEAYVIENPSWKNEKDYLNRFSRKHRYNLKQEVFKHESLFNIEIVCNQRVNLDRYFELYKNVAQKSFEISSFDLPIKLFENIIKFPNWEIIELRLKPQDDREKELLIGVNFCYKSSQSYNFLIVGIDYRFINSHNIYKQALWQAISRSNKLASLVINLGVTAGITKRKLGAKAVDKIAFIQMKDNFNMNLIEVMSKSTVSIK